MSYEIQVLDHNVVLTKMVEPFTETMNCHCYEYFCDKQKDGTYIVDDASNVTRYKDEMLEKAAPYIKDGSFIIYKGEDNHYWKLKFKDGEMIYCPGKLVFFED